MSGDRAFFVHASSYVDEPSSVGEGTSIWHFCHVMAGATIGRRCVLGQNVHIASGVVVGDDVRVQNNVSLYEGVVIESEVFLGPSCVLTNVTNPRAEISRRDRYESTRVRRGATIGANATIRCGITIGRYAFVGAGALVLDDVPDYGLVLGVPARHAGWMSRHGHRLPEPDGEGTMICPESAYRYACVDGAVRCLDLDEDAPLPGGRREALLP